MKKPSASTRPDFFSAQVSQARRFYLNLKPAAHARLVVVSGGVEHCAPDYAISRATFPFYSIEFVAQGSGELGLNGAAHALERGGVFSYGPGIPHQISTSLKSPLVKYFVDFAGTSAIRLLRGGHLKPGTMAQVFPPTEIQPLFEELVHNGLRGTPQSPAICATLLEGLLLKIQDSRAPLPGLDSLAFSTFQKCRQHMSENFLRLHSLAQVSRECHTDEAYLCRLFKRYDQQTPYRFLIRLKMNYAAQRLQSPQVLVKQIAEETGFANPFHFSKVFKSVFGLPPGSLIKIR